MFDLLGAGANSQKSIDTSDFDSSFDFLLEDDAALMEEQMGVERNSMSRCGGGNKENVATPPPVQNSGCGQKGCGQKSDKGVIATPPVLEDTGQDATALKGEVVTSAVEEEGFDDKGNVATPPFQAIDPDNLDIDEVTDDSIKSILDAQGEFTFEFDDNTYTLRLGEDGKYKAFDANGNVVDGEVRIQDNFTVDGFVEVGGLSGLGRGNRLYIGQDPQTGELSFIEATAELDANDAEIGGRTHLETLIETGQRHDVILGEGDKGNVATPPVVSAEQKAEQTSVNNVVVDNTLQSENEVGCGQAVDCGQKGEVATPISAPSSGISPPDMPEGFQSTSTIDLSALNALFARILGEGWNNPSKIE